MNLLDSLTNFLEYGSIRIEIHTFLKNLGILNTQTIREIGPINTFTNSIIDMDSKEVSKLYKSRNSGKDSIWTNIMNKWKEKTEQIFTHDEIEKAFTINHQSNVNMHMHFN